MAVYVDEAKYPYGRMLMCHMVADTNAELLRMAEAIGVDKRHIQKAGTAYEHFDVSKGARAKAVNLGAIEVSSRDIGRMVLRRKALTKETT
jgi:hypothetical protein